MIDDCIISELDFWSRNQQEHIDNDIKTALLSLELSNDSLEKLKGINKTVDMYYRHLEVDKEARQMCCA